ncbi:hypothetical protein CANARDRAFT_17227 [[Candida] arabinofermentans NRRL YB-2248]|uniref:Uncharacterized protein n=1 Tax=[Candida] arabinofermentans NRRL YB-2248 TaxID=983967 RepID=A0A1E4T2I3_9ASCO|nr:hypothetical protein CANARDRAFT_17227 [[Candida] arabinofermentans NRRL YB-2248]
MKWNPLNPPPDKKNSNLNNLKPELTDSSLQDEVESSLDILTQSEASSSSDDSWSVVSSNIDSQEVVFNDVVSTDDEQQQQSTTTDDVAFDRIQVSRTADTRSSISTLKDINESSTCSFSIPRINIDSNVKKNEHDDSIVEDDDDDDDTINHHDKSEDDIYDKSDILDELKSFFKISESKQIAIKNKLKSIEPWKYYTFIIIVIFNLGYHMYSNHIQIKRQLECDLFKQNIVSDFDQCINQVSFFQSYEKATLKRLECLKKFTQDSNDLKLKNSWCDLIIDDEQQLKSSFNKHGTDSHLKSFKLKSLELYESTPDLSSILSNIKDKSIQTGSRLFKTTKEIDYFDKLDKAKKITVDKLETAKELGSHVVDVTKELGSHVIDVTKEIDYSGNFEKAKKITVDHEVTKELGSHVIDVTKEIDYSGNFEKAKKITTEHLNKAKRLSSESLNKANEVGEMAGKLSYKGLKKAVKGSKKLTKETQLKYNQFKKCETLEVLKDWGNEILELDSDDLKRNLVDKPIEVVEQSAKVASKFAKSTVDTVKGWQLGNKWNLLVNDLLHDDDDDDD